ncbi:MAG: extracellular solute-binding protein [Clostridia bacterium]|nr:extracellular solute-binding protein [Clostridia bacterium]
MKQRILAVLLIAVLCLGAVGCKKQETVDEYGRDILKLFIINGNYLEGAKKDSAWKHIEEKSHTSLRIEGAVNNADYYTRLSPMLNSGRNMPDVFFSVPTATDGAYFKWADQNTGILYNLDELLLGREDEFPYLSKVIYSDKYGNIKYDGAHTIIPAPDDNSGWAIYYRGDWLVNVGYYQVDASGEPILDGAGNKIPRTPATLEEFEDVCYKFRNGDPNKSGKKDTYAMAPQNEAHCLSPLYHAFGVPADWDIDKDGNVSFMYTDPAFKNFLTWYNKLYSDGVIYDQFYTLNEASERKMFEEGETGIVITNGGEACLWVAKPCEEVFGYGKVTCGAPPVGTANLGQEGACGFSDWGGWWGGFSITKTCANPDAVLRLFDYLLSPEGGMIKNYGLEGVHYTLVDRRIVPNFENRQKEPEGSFTKINDADGNSVLGGGYRFASVLGGKAIDWEHFEQTGAFSVYRDNRVYDGRYADLMDLQDELRVEHSTNLLNFTDIPTVVMRKQLIIQDKMKTYAINAISGKKNLTTDWDAVLADCDSNGMADIKLMLATAADEAGILAKLQ